MSPHEAKRIAVRVLRAHSQERLAELAERDPDEIWVPLRLGRTLILISGRAEYPDIILHDIK